MEQRFEDINNFLKMISQTDATSKDIRQALKMWKLTEKDITFEWSDRFVYEFLAPEYMGACDDTEWFKRFGIFNALAMVKGGENLSVRKDISDITGGKNNPYFLSFYNPECIINREGQTLDPIKMYVPIGKEYALLFLHKLMDFLDENNILHVSKLAAAIRTDDIVLRLYSLSDAEKVAEFVNENIYESSIETNPFVFRSGAIGYTMDDGQSYNRYVSEIIEKYITDKKEAGEKAEIGYDDFKLYVDRIDDDRSIVKALKFSLEPEKTLQDFYKMWNQINDRDNPQAGTEEALDKRRESEFARLEERKAARDSSEFIAHQERSKAKRERLKENFRVMCTINAQMAPRVSSGLRGLRGTSEMQNPTEQGTNGSRIMRNPKFLRKHVEIIYNLLKNAVNQGDETTAKELMEKLQALGNDKTNNTQSGGR